MKTKRHDIPVWMIGKLEPWNLKVVGLWDWMVRAGLEQSDCTGGA